MHKKKQWITGRVMTIMALIAAYILATKKKTTLDEDLKNFAVKDTASINKIIITEKNGKQAVLEKNDKGVWMINAKFPARMDAVELLLYTFLRTEMKFPPGAEAKKTIIRSIATEGRKVEVFQQGERTKIWYIGTSTPDHTGTPMLLSDPETDEKYEEPFVTWIPGFDGFLSTRFFTDENDWRNRNLLSVSPAQMQTVKMEYTNYPDSSFQITVHDIQHFTISHLNNQTFVQADTAAIKQYLAYFLDLSAEVYLSRETEPAIDSVRRTNYFAQLSVTDKTGKLTQLRFYHKQPETGKEELYGEKVPFDPDHIYISYNSNNDFALGQYYTFGKVMQSARYFAPPSVKK